MRLSHIRGIDTIRAVGVVIVVIYHFFTDALPGGFFGVDVFFVISGFLMTSLLIREQKEKGRIDIIKFYTRRVTRLLPAAAFMVVVTLALALLISPDLRVGMREQTAAVFGWVTNYFEIMMGASYEDQFIPHLFVHTWTLGVEMQYYLIWGAVLTIVLALYKRYSYKIDELNRLIYGMNRSIISERLILFLICIGIAIFAYIRMQLKYMGLDDPSPVYYATSTRMYPLMIGSALGILTGMNVPKKRLPILVALPLFLLSLILLIRMSFVFTFSGASTYSYGILIASLLAVLAVYSLLSLQPKKFFIDLPPLAYLGQRSYSIYLFHWPLYNIFKQMGINGTGPFPENTPHIVYTIIAIAVTMVFAEISYRVFEMKKPVQALPPLEGATVATAAETTAVIKETKDGPVAEVTKEIPDGTVVRRKARRLGRVTAIIFVVCTILSGFTLATIPERTTIETDYIHQQVLVNAYNLSQYNDYLAGLQMSPVALNGRSELLPPTPSEIAAGKDINTDSEQTQQNAENALNRDDPAGPVLPVAPPGGANVTVIGDSVTLGAADVIIQTLGSVVVDAEVSRNMGAGPGMINDFASRGELGEFVVIALFTNAQYNTEPMTHETLAAIPAGHRVVLVTPFGYDYMEPVAEMVRLLPEQYDFVTVADWNLAIRDNTDLLAPDGLHMSGNDSRQLYANLLAKAIDQASRKPAKR